MRTVTDCIREDREYAQLLQGVRAAFRATKPLPLAVNGLCDGAAEALYVSMIRDVLAERGGVALVICADEKECVKTASLLGRFGLKSAFYTARDYNFYNIIASHEYEHERLRVLFGLLFGSCEVVVSTPDALLSYTMPRQRLIRSVIDVDFDSIIDQQEFARRLVEAGYSRVDMVDGTGQFSVRGGIIDVYPPYGVYEDDEGEVHSGAFAIRIDLFGDEIDRMGIFEIQTQRIVTNLMSSRFSPAREVIADCESAAKIRAIVTRQLKRVTDERIRDELRGEISSAEAAEQGSGELHFADKYITQIYPERECLLDYLSDKRILTFMDGTNAIADRIKASEWNLNQQITDLLESGVIASQYTEYAKPFVELERFCDGQVCLHMDSLSQGLSGKRLGGMFSFRSKHTVDYADKFPLLCEDLEEYVRSSYRIWLLCDNETVAKNTCGLLNDKGFSARLESADNEEMPGKGEILVKYREFVKGFELPTSRIAVISTHGEGKDFSTTAKGKKKKNRKKSATKTILSYDELEVGDYVVHEAYGIGQYLGIENMTVDGVSRDYINIKYAGSDRLFLPVDKLDLVSKYIGARSEDGLVKLSKFGGAEWGRAKARAKAAVKDMAKELIELYAQRLRRKGHAFPPDDDFQRDFEAAFEFDETDAQLDAIDEIKADMIKPTPMDRLLCGDVGFGKTEVAFRAAYKAVLDGKQVAILVPTTILALQHYQTAQSRMRSFAVNVDMISRFRTAKQQEVSLRRLKRGETDIIIGTHRLISKDVEFHDLGLLIVDEEQRFGVAQKERLKQLAGNIDVLTLTATPIPRTLNMAMGGIRDISILDEAPDNRLPIQTYVMESDEIILYDAIRRELRRGGQVFYMHNVIDSIYAVAAKISKAIPDATVTVAHGRMEREQLEDIWASMLSGETDILVCTSIIETGIDVPNANTLIVDNAHRLGLSQLHQIRGRVGRSARRAYAYFTYPPNMALSEIAEKRLEALRDYAEFGAGFKIAMRDMELRGAGNLLGAQQHGHLDAVGYDMYIKLLNEAVLEESGKTPERKIECTVSLRFDANIPDSYVRNSGERMALYKRIALIEEAADREDITDELLDRYGNLPKPTQNLLTIALIRSLAMRCGCTAVEQDGMNVKIYPERIDIEIWSELEEAFPRRLRIVMATRSYINLKLRREDDVLRLVTRLFETYTECMKQIQKAQEVE